jgi:hypothetical protein
MTIKDQSGSVHEKELSQKVAKVIAASEIRTRDLLIS